MNKDMGASASQTWLSSPIEPASGLAPTGFDPSRVFGSYRHPTDDELREGAAASWAISGPFNIDQWPEDVRALSMPTKLIPVEDITRFQAIFDGDDEVMAEYAARLDGVMGWDQHFIRLNSRSPKDTAFPALPITCAGKQAMWWIAGSMRCLDDTSLHKLAGKPLFICAREWRPIRPEWEFRCFAKGREVIAVSRYDYGNPSVVPDDFASQAMEAARTFYHAHLAHHYADVVFDLHAPGSSQELLIELNPYGLSDPCLFGSYDEVEKGGVLVGNRDTDRRAGA